MGCGPGHVTRFLAARHARVIGVDVSPGMISVAREHAPALTFAVGSMLQLPVAGSALSGVIADGACTAQVAGDVTRRAGPASRPAWRAATAIIATGPYIGEGFDCPALDTLFLAAPVGYKGSIVQMGRTNPARPSRQGHR